MKTASMTSQEAAGERRGGVRHPHCKTVSLRLMPSVSRFKNYTRQKLRECFLLCIPVERPSLLLYLYYKNINKKPANLPPPNISHLPPGHKQRKYIFKLLTAPKAESLLPLIQMPVIFLGIKYDNYITDSFLFIYTTQFHLDSVFHTSPSGNVVVLLG